MKKKTAWLVLSLIMVLALIAAVSCTPEATPTPTVKTPTLPSTTPTATPAGNWWDELGEPEYGGTINYREGDFAGVGFDITSPYGCYYTSFYMEPLFYPDWTLSRDIWPMKSGYCPTEYIGPGIATSWEQTDPVTWTVKIRDDVYYQSKPPVNGRQFTAEDVQYSYDMMLGTGSGFTEPNMFWASAIPSIDRVVAVDDFTVEFQLKEPTPMALEQIMEAQVTRAFAMVAKEWWDQGDHNNWENAVGTGPWLLTDYQVGTSITFERNPDYWGYDERYPENQIPYLDSWKGIGIPDLATAVAALRTAKIDLIMQTRGGLSWQQGETLAASNPEVMQGLFPNPGFSVDMRCDTEPWTDINVRKAMQMAVNLEDIAESLYGGYVDPTPCGVMNPVYADWAYNYDEWTPELKAEYGFDPEVARQLLADAGYPDGFETNMIVSTNDDLQLAQVFASYWSDIGVEVAIDAVDGNTFRSIVQAGQHDALAFSSATSMPFSPDWCIRFRENTNTRDNFAYHNDATYDNYIRQFDEATTIEEAKQISVEADKYLLEQHWSVQTFPQVVVFAWQPWVGGYMGEVIIGGTWHPWVPTRLWLDSEMKASMQ